MSAKKIKKWLPKWAEEIGVLFGGQAKDMPLPEAEGAGAGAHPQTGGAPVLPPAVTAEGAYHFGIQELLALKAALAEAEEPKEVPSIEQVKEWGEAFEAKAQEGGIAHCALSSEHLAEGKAPSPQPSPTGGEGDGFDAAGCWKKLEPQIAAILKVTPFQLYRCRKCGGAMQEDGEAAATPEMIYRCVGCGQKKLESVLEVELKAEVTP